LFFAVLTNLKEQAIRTEFKNAFKEDFFSRSKAPPKQICQVFF